jgi:hypothetical protein
MISIKWINKLDVSSVKERDDRESGCLALFVKLSILSLKNFLPTRKENSSLMSGPVSFCVCSASYIS